MTIRQHNTGSHSSPHAIVPGSRVRRSDEVAPIGGPHSHEGSEPVVELVKDGDVVQAIDVTCRCGHKMRVWCSYEPE